MILHHSCSFVKISYGLVRYCLPSATGTTTKITTIPMTSKPNVIVVQKTTGKGATIQGLPGKNVVTTLLNAGVSQTSHCRDDSLIISNDSKDNQTLDWSVLVCFDLLCFL